MGYNDHLRDASEQSTAVWTEEQFDGDEYSRADDEDDGEDSYWNYTDN